MQEAIVLAQTVAATLRALYAIDAPNAAQLELEALLTECAVLLLVCLGLAIGAVRIVC